MTVNMRVSALPNTVPPRYNKQKIKTNRMGKIIFLQFIMVGIMQNNMHAAIMPFIGNLNKVSGF